MKINQLLEGLNTAIAIHDDITMFGKDDDAHDQNLIALRKRAQEVRLTLNSMNGTIRHPKISFFGVSCGKNGVSPDQNKMQGMLDMPPKQM